jgi:hypothetical protein
MIMTSRQHRHIARGGILSFACALALSFTPPTRAQSHSSIALHYVRAQGAEGCPDESMIRDTVSARLGYDPFDPQSTTKADVSLTKSGKKIRARIRIYNPTGSLGSRELDSDSLDCSELASSVSFALAIAIDPLMLTRKQEPPASVLPAPSASQAAAPSLEIPQPPPPRPPPPLATPQVAGPRLRAGIRAASAFGVAPSTAFGASVFAGARWTNTSLSLEGQFYLPASRTDSDGIGVQSSLVAAALVPCAHSGKYFACIVALAGGLQGRGTGLNQPQNATTLYAATGARLGFELPLSDIVAVVPSADLMGTLTRTSLRVSDHQVWSTPVLWGSVGISITGTIP